MRYLIIGKTFTKENIGKLKKDRKYYFYLCEFLTTASISNSWFVQCCFGSEEHIVERKSSKFWIKNAIRIKKEIQLNREKFVEAQMKYDEELDRKFDLEFEEYKKGKVKNGK